MVRDHNLFLATMEVEWYLHFLFRLMERFSLTKVAMDRLRHTRGSQEHQHGQVQSWDHHQQAQLHQENLIDFDEKSQLYCHYQFLKPSKPVLNVRGNENVNTFLHLLCRALYTYISKPNYPLPIQLEKNIQI